MYNTKDLLVFNPASALPETLPPNGRLGLYIFTGGVLSLIDSTGAVVNVTPIGIDGTGAALGEVWTAGGANDAGWVAAPVLDTNAVGAMDTAADIDLADGVFVTATLAANTTITISNPPSGGGAFDLLLTNGGAFTPTWPAAVLWAGGIEPTWTAAGDDLARFTTFDGGTTWVGTAVAMDVQ